MILLVDVFIIERASSLQIDLRMLPLLGLLYAVALIDRTNLGIARAAGMEKDLVRIISAPRSFSCSRTQPYLRDWTLGTVTPLPR